MASAARAPGAAVLPPLREEIGISRGPAALDGSPTWTLHDPAVNRFYRLGWPEFEIVSRWDSRDADELVARVNAETTLRIEPTTSSRWSASCAPTTCCAPAPRR